MSGSMVIVAPKGKEIGFRLGGVPSVGVERKEELNDTVAQAVNGGAALLCLPESMRPWLAPRWRQALESEEGPVTLYYHYPEVWGAAPEIEEALAVMVRHTLGYKIKIKL